jgi:putative MATE family efflux protein
MISQKPLEAPSPSVSDPPQPADAAALPVAPPVVSLARPHGGRELTLMGLAWPIFVEQGLRILISTVDTLMVSHISDGAVAALSVASQVVILAIILFNFIGVGSSVVITHHLGAGDIAGAARISRAAVGVNTWVGLVVSATVAAFAEPILHLMQLPPSLLPHARPFLVLMGGTLFLEAQNTAMAATLRAHGRTRPVMLTTGLQNVINLLGNCLLLFGLFGLPRLGVPGVALSGIVSRLVCFTLLRGLLRSATGVRLRPRDYFALPLEPMRRILRIGLPAVGENLSYWLALMLVTSFASRMGETHIAAFAYSRQVSLWVILFIGSVGLATEILVGHRIGAGDFERARRELIVSLRKGFALALMAGSLVAAIAPYALAPFTNDAAVLAAAVTLQRVDILVNLGRVFNVVIVYGLRATGDSRFPLLIGLGSMWGVWVPLAWLFGVHLGVGLPGLYIGMIVDEWLRGLLNLGRWRRGGWIAQAELSRAHVGAAANEEAQRPQ